MDPEAFINKAAADPHGAVAAAIRLFNETGRNIKKFDPATGATLLPDAFHDALTATQNVSYVLTV